MTPRTLFAQAMRALVFGVLALGLATWAAPPAAAPAASQPEAFSGDRAMAHVRALADDIGSRVAGTEAHERGVAYIAQYWRSLGYEPLTTLFSFNAYDDRMASIEVQGTAPTVQGFILRGSPSGTVRAEVIDAGLGRPEDLRGLNLSGRIALIQRGELRFNEKVANAAARGALATIIDNNQSGSFYGSLAGASSIPAVGISDEDGASLRGLLAAGPLSVRLVAETDTREAWAGNVEIRRRGAGNGIVVIGGHIDSVPAGPGANDNASGTAVVMELGRTILSRSYPFEVRLVGFGAEEIGLIGSNYYVDQLSESERSQMRAMINLDMVGVGTAWRFGGTQELALAAMGIARDFGQPAGRLGTGLNMASDHANFINAGVPSLFVHRVDDPNYHTPGDRAELVEPSSLETAGRIVLALLDQLAAENG